MSNPRVSSARAEAARRNGAKSRGPRTPEGKARASRNALKHGLRAEKHVVLPEEDAAEFAALAAALIEELAPEGVLQATLAGQIARASWRLARAERIELELFAERRYGDAGSGLALIRDGNGTRSFETLMRYRGAALAEVTRALRTLKALQAEKAVRAPARAAAARPAPVRLAALPASAATLAAAREILPDEPESRGNPGEPARSDDRANPSAPRAGVPSPAGVSAPAGVPAMPLPASGKAALGTRPIEPEASHPRDDGPAALAGLARRGRGPHCRTVGSWRVYRHAAGSGRARQSRAGRSVEP